MRELYRWNVGPLNPNVLNYSPCGNYLAIGNQFPSKDDINDGYVSIDILAAHTGEKLKSLSDKTTTYRSDYQDVKCLSWSPDSRKLVVGHGVSGGVQLWDIEAGTRTELINDDNGMYIHDVMMTDSHVYTIDSLNRQRTFDIRTGLLVAQHKDNSFGDPVSVEEHESEPHNNICAISPSGKLVLLETNHSNADRYCLELRCFGQKDTLWRDGDIESGNDLIQFIDDLTACTLSRGQLFKIELATGKKELLLDVGYWTKGMALSRDGTLFASIGNGLVGPESRGAPLDLIVWDTISGEQVSKVEIERGLYKGLSFGPVMDSSLSVAWRVCKEDIIYNQLLGFNFR